MAHMLGSRTNVKLPWSQCNCGCLAGAKSRKAERRIQRRVEKEAVRRQVSAEMAHIGTWV